MFQRSIISHQSRVLASHLWTRRPQPQPLIGRRALVLDSFNYIKSTWAAFAETLLKNKKAQNINMIENTLKSGLSIEEKEKLYRKIGLVDSGVVNEVRAATEAAMVARIQEAEAAAKAAAEAAARKELKEATALAEAETRTEVRNEMEKEIWLAKRAARAEAEAEFRAKAEKSAGGAPGAAAPAEAATPRAAAPETVPEAGKMEGSAKETTKGGSASAAAAAASSALSGAAVRLPPSEAPPVALGENGQSEWDPSSGQLVQVHPILGEQLGRALGNRRLFLMDVPNLSKIPVWEKQRVYRMERAKAIADGLLTSHNRRVANGKADHGIQLPGVIVIYEKAWEQDPMEDAIEAGDSPTDDEILKRQRMRYGIVDGQHRVGAVRMLHNQNMYAGRVLVEMFSLQSEAEVAELFTDINKAEPVREVDLPDVGAGPKEQDILRSALAALTAQYSTFFKKSSACKRPHLFADKLRDDLFKAKVVSSNNLNTDAELLAWLMQRNSELEQRSDEEWLEMLKGNEKGKRAALEKCRKGSFYLGLDSKWIGEYANYDDGQSDDD